MAVEEKTCRLCWGNEDEGLLVQPCAGDRTIRVSDFTVHNYGFKKALADPKPAGSSFLISRFWFQRRPPFMGSEASTFLDSNFSILIAQIAEN